MPTPSVYAVARALGTGFNSVGGISETAGTMCVSVTLSYVMTWTFMYEKDIADEDETQQTECPSCCSWNINPPGSLVVIKNEMGRPCGRSLMRAIEKNFDPIFYEIFFLNLINTNAYFSYLGSFQYKDAFGGNEDFSPHY